MSNGLAQELMTDKEVCDVLRISVSTLRRYMKKETSGIQNIKRVNVGGQRRWVRDAVLAFVSGQ